MVRITEPRIKASGLVVDASGLGRQSIVTGSSAVEAQWSYTIGPVNAFALREQPDEAAPLIAIGKRDGMLMLLDADGNLVRKTVMPSDIRTLAATGEGDAAHLAVATAQGIQILDSKLATQSSIAVAGCGALSWLEDNGQRTVVGMTDHGDVAAYSVE